MTKLIGGNISDTPIKNIGDGSAFSAGGGGFTVPSLSNDSSVTQYGTDVRPGNGGLSGLGGKAGAIWKHSDNHWGLLFLDTNDSNKAKYVDVTFSSGTPTFNTAQDLSGTISASALEGFRCATAPDGTGLIMCMRAAAATRAYEFYSFSGVSSNQLQSVTSESSLNFNTNNNASRAFVGSNLFNVDNDRYIVTGDEDVSRIQAARVLNVTTSTLGSRTAVSHALLDTNYSVGWTYENGELMGIYARTANQTEYNVFTVSGTTLTLAYDQDHWRAQAAQFQPRNTTNTTPQQGTGATIGSDHVGIVLSTAVFFSFEGVTNNNVIGGNFFAKVQSAGTDGPDVNASFIIPIKEDGNIKWFCIYKWDGGHPTSARERLNIVGVDVPTNNIIIGDTFWTSTPRGDSAGSAVGIMIGAEGDNKLTVVSGDGINNRLGYFTVDIG